MLDYIPYINDQKKYGKIRTAKTVPITFTFLGAEICVDVFVDHNIKIS